MIYAPILIPTLCRYEHFVRLIESLKRNSWAKYTDIYIGLDYPPSKKYEDGYKKIDAYLKGDFPEFASFNIVRHKKNLGSSENMRNLREMVSKKYDCFIRTDDDAEFSPNFIEYMDKCLMEYESDPCVIAVSGYSYPVKWKVTEGANVFKQNFICPMWGVGFWVKKYEYIREQIEDDFLQKSVEWVFRNNKMKKMLDVCKFEYVNLCLSPIFKETLAAGMTDVAVRMYTAINDNYVITPVVSKVRNWGFDGSGEYCFKIDEMNGGATTGSYLYNKQPIDRSVSFELIPDSLNVVDTNRMLLNQFDKLTLEKKIKLYIKIFLCKLFGIKNYCKIKNRVRK